MSFLKIGDRAAGAIKSGGTTRRAAKMVCLDLDHPDIEQFVNWKVREELKVACMVEGLKAGVPALAKFLADDVPPFDPAHPDPLSAFDVPASPAYAGKKPDGS